MEALSLTASPFKIRLNDYSPSLASFSSGDDAADILRKLHLLQDENRMCSAEPNAKPRKENVVDDMLADFKGDIDDCEDEGIGDEGSSSKRVPFKSLTNTKNQQKNGSKAADAKKDKKQKMATKTSKATASMGTSSIIDNSSINSISTQKHAPINDHATATRQNDYRTSKLTIGISTPTYEVDRNYEVDPSLPFNFLFPTTEECLQNESQHNFYEDSPANSTLSWFDGLSVIPECDEEAEFNEEETLTVTKVNCNRDDPSVDALSREEKFDNGNISVDTMHLALRPLLSTTSVNDGFSDYYTDEPSKSDEHQFMSSHACCIFTSLTKLFMNKKKRQNCFVPDC